MLIRIMQSLLILTFVIGITGCNFIGIAPGKEELPEVSALSPPILPDWIEQISPLGDAKPLQQIGENLRITG